MLKFINMVSNVEHHKDFGKTKVGLILQIIMVSLNGILDIGKVENQMMLRDRMLDGKAL